MTNDKELELAKVWARAVDSGERLVCTDRERAAARYILATLADDRDARIEALTKELATEQDDHRKAAEQVSVMRLANISLRQETERMAKELATERDRHAAVIDDFAKQKRIVQKEREEVARLTKERDEAMRLLRRTTDMALNPPVWTATFDAEKPAAEDAELDTRVQKLGNLVRGTGAWFDAVECAIELLAARVKEMRRG